MIERRLLGRTAVLLGVLLGLALGQTTPSYCPVPGTPTEVSGLVNTYYPGLGTAAAGGTSLSVGPKRPSSLTGNDIQPGDTVLIVQMQDAFIDVSQSAAYGTPTALNNAGRYEYAEVASVSGGTLTFTRPLTNSYTTAEATATVGQRRYQVVRVPKYGNARVTGTLTALPWNGTTGGVMAVDTTGQLDTGTGTAVDVSGQGFRGGAGVRMSGDGTTPVDPFGVWAASSYVEGLVPDRARPHGTKGEGIAGTPLYISPYVGASTTPDTTLLDNTDPDQTDQIHPPSYSGVEGYPTATGSNARGAPANGGGGGTDGQPFNNALVSPVEDGNSFNSGGGGGGNGGAGGKGGNTWGSWEAPEPADPAGTAPRNSDLGGRGGRGLDTLGGVPAAGALPERIYLGGGGGSGSINDNNAYSASGGNGGGMVLLRTGSIAGSGRIVANGIKAPDIDSSNPPGRGRTAECCDDGAGGGGAGGTIIVQTANAGGLGSVDLEAKGGAGGNTRLRPSTELAPPIGTGLYDASKQKHGPGGGGGGGAVYTTGSPRSIAVEGGSAGQTLRGTPLAETYGAAPGSLGVQTVGVTPSPVPGTPSCLSISKRTTTPSVPSGTPQATYIIRVENAAGQPTAENVVISDNLALLNPFTYARTVEIRLGRLAGGTADPVRVASEEPTPGSANPSWGRWNIPAASYVELEFLVNLNGAAAGVYQNTAAATFDDATAPGGRRTITYDAATSIIEDVTVGPPSGNPIATNDETRTPFNTPITFGEGGLPSIDTNDSAQCRAILATGGRLTLLDGSTPVDTLTIAGRGTFTLGTGNRVTFTPVQGFIGVAEAPYGYLNPPVPPGSLNPDCRATIRVTVSGPELRKAVNQTLVKVGEDLEYTLTVVGRMDGARVVIEDLLPEGLVYRAGTSRRDGTAIADPAITNEGGRQKLTYTLTGVTSTGELQIRFRAWVTDRVRTPIVNSASASISAPGTGGGTITTPVINSNTVNTIILGGVFSPSGEILGRVYFDRNQDNNFTQGIDEPLPGARVYLSNGRFAVTDSLGRYSIPSVEPGLYAIRVDRLTAPYTLRSVPDYQGQLGTRYVRVTGPGIYHEDFLYGPPIADVSRVRSTWVRRGSVVLEKVVTQIAAGTYTITLTLTTPTPLRNLEITDPLPAGTVREGLAGAGLQPSASANLIRLPGVVEPGTYSLTYTLNSNLSLDQIVTDPDLFWDEVIR